MKKGYGLKGKEILFDDSIGLIKDDSTNVIFRESPICGDCLHYIVKNLFDEGYERTKNCDAFPNGIPEEIWLGKNGHTKPYEGDNGLRYTKPSKEKIIEVLKRYIDSKGVSSDTALSLLNQLEGA